LIFREDFTQSGLQGRFYIYALSFFAYIAENGVYLNGKFDKEFSKEIKKTILKFNSLGELLG
jgi:hypothetical protein